MRRGRRRQGRGDGGRSLTTTTITTIDAWAAKLFFLDQDDPEKRLIKMTQKESWCSSSCWSDDNHGHLIVGGGHCGDDYISPNDIEDTWKYGIHGRNNFVLVRSGPVYSCC